MSTLRELEIERISPQLLEVLRRQGFASLTDFQLKAINSGIMRNQSQILVTYDFDEAYEIAEIALLNSVASDVRSKIVLLCPNPHQVEKRLHSLGQKSRRLGIEVTPLLRKRQAIRKGVKTGRVIVGTYHSLDLALRTNPEMFEGVKGVLIDRLDLIGQSETGTRLESFLVNIRGMSDDIQTVGICPMVADLDDLSTWLEAAVVEDPKPDIRRIYSVKVFSNMYDSLAELTEFVHYQRGQILILCSDIETCENVASNLAGTGEDMRPILDLRLTPEYRDKLREIASDVMKHFGESEMTTKLALNISKGVAFMHEGVSRLQRRVISSGWEDGSIPVLLMPIRFSLASGFRATVVFLVGVFTQEVEEDLSDSENLTILSEWQLSEVLNSAGRRGQDNEAYGIVVVDREIEKQRVIAKYFLTNPDGSIRPVLGEVDSTMDNPENLQDLALVSLCGRGRRAESLFSVIDRTYWATGHRISKMQEDILLPTEDTSVDELVSLRATKATIKRAEEIPDDAVKLVSVTPSKIAGLVRSSSRELWHYVILKSEEGVSCSCESWKYQGIRKHRLCKHLVKFSNFVIDDIDLKPYAVSIIRTALWGLEIVGELEGESLLYPEGKTMRCTKLGTKIAMLGIPVRDARNILRVIRRKDASSTSILRRILNANTNLPKKLIDHVLDSIPIGSVGGLISEQSVKPGLIENALEDLLYSLDMVSALDAKILDKKTTKELKMIEENIQSLLSSVS